MATDPRCPDHVLTSVLAHPTAKRLAHLAGITDTDLATDLSSLIALALDTADTCRQVIDLDARASRPAGPDPSRSLTTR
jgi:hypothetical protein